MSNVHQVTEAEAEALLAAARTRPLTQDEVNLLLSWGRRGEVDPYFVRQLAYLLSRNPSEQRVQLPPARPQTPSQGG